MNNEEREVLRKYQAKGGKNRWAKLTKEERTELAKKMVEAKRKKNQDINNLITS